MMATVNNNVYLKVVKRIYLKSSHHIEENINESNCGNHLIYIYILYISNDYVVLLKIIQCYMSVKLKKKSVSVLKPSHPMNLS